MRCFLTFTIAAALAAGISSTTWSQTGGAGGAGGTAGGAGSAGTAGGTSAAGTSNSSNAAAANAQAGGTNGNGGTVGTANGVGTAGNAGAAGNAGTAGGAGSAGVNTNGNRAGAANRANGRVDGSSAQRNTGAGLGANGNVNANANGFFNGISPTPFFNDSGARQQLNLNPNQYNSLNQAYQNAYSRYNQAVSHLDPNLTEQQRESQLQQLQAQFNQSLSGTVNNTITNPQNQARFNQLNRQFNGFNSFNDPTVRRQLNLSQDQIRQLRTLSGNWREQMQRMRRTGVNQATADPAQWTQMQQQYAAQLNGVLTPEQQQMWAQQIGKPYIFSPDTYLGGPNAEAGTQQQGNVGTGNQQQGNVGTGNRSVFQPDNRGAQTRGTNQQGTPQANATPGAGGTAR